ncbi:MAG: hypothetical protein KGD70_12365 [Candidatus Lokiarchaeota archaeon]|nr:hypothetical protein [Candidatus Lokiarchaeota archaeon]
MGEDELIVIRKVLCDHIKQRHYTQRRLDILNGFELVLTRCINCHKVLNLEARRISQAKNTPNPEKKLVTILRNLSKNLKKITRKNGY